MKELDKLNPDVHAKALNVIDKCRKVGVEIHVYCTLRSLDEQARFFRQSRTLAEIQEKIRKFRERGFGFLADIIEGVGPQNGPWVTNAAPGESWHNYAEAFDAVPLTAGKADWRNNVKWDLYGRIVKENGLRWGGDFIPKYKDVPHAQLRQGSNPLKVYTPEQVREILTTNSLL